jgi:LysR family transcriptional activator of mexEF-oprN operon
MAWMHAYARDLDLNLLRVFVVVAEAGSVTGAAEKLYLTQPAVSAALQRLRDAVGAPLFVRSGRGIALTARGARLLDEARPHLDALVRAALVQPAFDAKTSDAVVRVGFSDDNACWLLPKLVRALGKHAPRMRLISIAVTFRSVADELVRGAVQLAVTVADELPADVRREPLSTGGFVCLFDPRHVSLGTRLTKERYLREEHVIVSYNRDLRGLVEDLLGMERRVRVSVGSFHDVGAVVEGGPLLATVPVHVAAAIRATRPKLRTVALPFATGSGTSNELLWRASVDDDAAVAFVRRQVTLAAR